MKKTKASLRFDLSEKTRRSNSGGGEIINKIYTNLYWIFLYAGVIGGFFLGLRWWQMVYVEHRHWKKWKKS